MRTHGKKIKSIALQTFLYLILFVIALFIFRPYILNAYEDLTFHMNPSAERAYEYGIRHFSDSYPNDYNLDRAEYYFTQAAEMDKQTPYVYHELARISFLRGNFPVALQQINTQIALHGDTEANSYYVRGLIEGFAGDYVDAIADYKHFLVFDPHDWAAINDYAWVLLKANKPAEAAKATTDGLKYFPTNPWLLNSNATALFEIGDVEGAKISIQKAQVAVNRLSNSEWSHAYPGNDPAIAGEGVSSFKEAVEKNAVQIMASSTATTSR